MPANLVANQSTLLRIVNDAKVIVYSVVPYLDGEFLVFCRDYANTDQPFFKDLTQSRYYILASRSAYHCKNKFD